MTNAPNRALLLMDYQVALCEEGPHLRMPPLAAQVAERGVLATAEKVLAAARTAGWLVVHVRLAFDPTYTLRTNRLARFDAYPDQRPMLADSPEAQIVAQLAPVDGEPVVDKGCVDPFVGTPLREVLAAEGITEVVLGGVATNLVVESAARHASDAGPAGDRRRGHVRVVPRRTSTTSRCRTCCRSSAPSPRPPTCWETCREHTTTTSWWSAAASPA